MKLTARNVIVAFALFCSFQFATGFIGGFWEGFRAATPFRIHASDVWESDREGGPWKINCPVCSGFPPDFLGYDRYSGRLISCAGCDGQRWADVRSLHRPVRVVEPSEPVDYAKPIRPRL